MPVYEYKGKKGTTYYIVYSVNGRRKKEAIGKDKKLAEKVLHKRLSEIAENKYLDIKKDDKIRFEDFAEQYLKVYCKPNHKSYHSDINNIKALKRFFGGKYLYEITSEDIEKFKAQRIEEGLAPATVNRNLAWLKSMFNRAIDWGRARVNPVRKVKLFRENNQRLRFLEKEEIARLLENCSEHLKPIVIMALHTGMRKGEILNLKWHDIDVQRGIIYLLNTKNSEKREVVMDDEVKKTVIAVHKHPDSPYIFCNKDGKPYGDIKKSFFTSCKKAGIINFHFHDLRHTFASQMRMAGVDLTNISEYLGHKTLQMTKRYAHLAPDYKRHDFEMLCRRIGAKSVLNLHQKGKLENKEDFALSQFIDNKEVGVFGGP